MDIGSAVGRKSGLSDQQIVDLTDFEHSQAFSEVEKLVLRYSAAMTETPVEVSDELFAQLRLHFNDKQLVELTSAIAWENYRARFNHALDIESEGFAEGGVCAVPARHSAV